MFIFYKLSSQLLFNVVLLSFINKVWFKVLFMGDLYLASWDMFTSSISSRLGFVEMYFDWLWWLSTWLWFVFGFVIRAFWNEGTLECPFIFGNLNDWSLVTECKWFIDSERWCTFAILFPRPDICTVSYFPNSHFVSLSVSFSNFIVSNRQ